MTASLNFGAMVEGWCRGIPERIEAVRNTAIDKLADEMARTRGQGGRVPFDTGNLARSIQASTSAMPTTAAGPFAGSNVGAVTATLQPDQAIWIGYQAAYARRMNYGFVGADSLGRVYNQAGNYFVEGAILQWRSFVAESIREIQMAAGPMKP